MAEKFRLDLRAVVYREGEWWIAHCLEMDLVAEGKTPRQALRDLLEISLAHVRYADEQGDLNSVFRPAPPEIWRMFSTAEDIEMRRKPAKPIERFKARELVLTGT